MALPAGHRPQLDGLRTIAVLLVAIYHWFNFKILGSEPPYGFIGVGLFFILSGYLITGILLTVRDKATQSGASLAFAARSFTIRRILRLVPALYLYLAIIAATGFYSDRAWGWYLLYAGNYRINALGEWPAGVAHLWSLAVEEQFYIVIPAFVLLFPREHIRTALLAAIAVVAVVGTVPGWYNPFLAPAAFQGLLVGCLLAVDASDTENAPINRWLRRRAWWLAGAFASFHVLSTNALLPDYLLTVRSLVGYLAMAGIVWAVTVGVVGLPGALLQHPAMQYLGRISYGLYLWHFFALFVRAEVFGYIPAQLQVVELVILSAITIAISVASHSLVERHVNKLKSRFPYIEPDESGALDREPAQAGRVS